MLVGRKYRVAFTAEQVDLSHLIGDACRAVWNTGLEQRREYRRGGAFMNYVQQSAELTQAKMEFRWLAQAPSHCLQQTLMDLDRACRDHGTFRVQWRSQRRWVPSFRFPDGRGIRVERLSRRWGRAKLPKLGWVRFRFSRPLDGDVRSATISRDGDVWFVSFLVDDETCTPKSMPVHRRSEWIAVSWWRLPAPTTLCATVSSLHRARMNGTGGCRRG